MDSAVIAALIAVPTAVIAATAAYAAGRAQARGAHRGPVDAVRREAQGNAYHAFTNAARGLSREGHITPLGHMNALREACIVVELEGPAHIADLARNAVLCADDLDIGVSLISDPITNMLLLGRALYFGDLRARRAAFDAAVKEFMTAAEDHLNGGGA